MPLYAYECAVCGTRFEQAQSVHAQTPPECPNGHTAARRIFSPPTVIFKGAGFYSTDNRRGGKRETTARKS